MQSAYVSESRDNYRKPQAAEDNQLLFNYFDADQIEQFKLRVYNLIREQEKENKN